MYGSTCKSKTKIYIFTNKNNVTSFTSFDDKILFKNLVDQDNFVCHNNAIYIFFLFQVKQKTGISEKLCRTI